MATDKALPREKGSDARIPLSHTVISSASEKSFSFAVKKKRESIGNGKHGTPYALGSRRFIREGNSERSTKSSLGGVYEERLFVIAMFFSISNFQDP